MIQVKPQTKAKYKCPECEKSCVSKDLIWQGIHILSNLNCSKCNTRFVKDLPIGQAVFTPYTVDTDSWKLYGKHTLAWNWFGIPLVKSLKYPVSGNVKLKVKKYQPTKKVVILNTIDYLYGHCFLKLVNLQRLIDTSKGLGVVVIVQKPLKWMVPGGVSEVWEVNISLNKARNYNPDLNKKIKRELERFSKIYIDTAPSHPRNIDIQRFTGVQRHDLSKKKYRVSFIWREDRPWVSNDYIVYGAKKITTKPLVYIQKNKVINLFKRIRKDLPDAAFTVVGLGKSFRFPDWIQDKRIVNFNQKVERVLCQVYSESRLVIGVHGSNMLLPSAQAGMTLDLVPHTRLQNIAQDVIYDTEENDERMISYRYRYYPINVPISSLASSVISMINDYGKVRDQFKPLLK